MGKKIEITRYNLSNTCPVCYNTNCIEIRFEYASSNVITKINGSGFAANYSPILLEKKIKCLKCGTEFKEYDMYCKNDHNNEITPSYGVIYDYGGEPNYIFMKDPYIGRWVYKYLGPHYAYI